MSPWILVLFIPFSVMPARRASICVESREICPISLSLLRLFDQRRMQPPRQLTFRKLRERSRKR